MKAAPTLADFTMRESFRLKMREMRGIRPLLAAANRFVLDETASAFISDLSNANYSGQSLKRWMVLFRQLRPLARLPHKITWIEYDAQAERRRTIEKYRAALGMEDDPAVTTGWLMRQHPTIETAFRMTMFSKLQEGEQTLGACAPYDIAWVTDNEAVPWLDESLPGEDPQTMQSVALGLITEFKSESDYSFFCPEGNWGVSIRSNAWTFNLSEKERRMNLASAGQQLRKAITLLAAINDVPIGVKHVTATKGFVAQGRYRKFLDHSVVTIVIPKGRDPQKVAAAVIKAMKRRAHQVRGHWRRDWRHEGNRIWIKEHQRGDATLGFVTHDYRVEHRVEEGAQP
jgi:hypothetical protein